MFQNGYFCSYNQGKNSDITHFQKLLSPCLQTLEFSVISEAKGFLDTLSKGKHS